MSEGQRLRIQELEAYIDELEDRNNDTWALVEYYISLIKSK